MKSNICIVILVLMLTISLLTGCEDIFKKTCKEPECEETEIYKDGYCKYHYYLNEGENILKDIVNN